MQIGVIRFTTVRHMAGKYGWLDEAIRVPGSPYPTNDAA
jgi:hypothetical protein